MRVIRKKSGTKGARTLGLLLRGYRQALGMSQRELALKVGVQRVSISFIENDRRRPSATLLHSIADILDVKQDRLFLLARPEAKLAIRSCFGSRIIAHDAAWLSAAVARLNVAAAAKAVSAAARGRNMAISLSSVERSWAAILIPAG